MLNPFPSHSPVMRYVPEKCPANTFQSKGICQPCPDGTYQDRGGQTECRPCTDRSLGTPSGHYISRCQRRSGRPVHPSIVAVSKLPNRKSRLSSPITTIQTRQLNGKLGNVAAAYTFADKQVVDTKHSGKKNQFLYSHQQPSSSSKSRRHHPYPYQLATSRMAISRSSAVTNETLDDDPCSPNPCLAGGACFRAVRYAENNRIVNSFKCSCRPGTTGKNKGRCSSHARKSRENTVFSYTRKEKNTRNICIAGVS